MVAFSASYTAKHGKTLFSQEQPAASNFIQKVTLTQVFSFLFCKFIKNTYFSRRPPVAVSKFLQRSYV